MRLKTQHVSAIALVLLLSLGLTVSAQDRRNGRWADRSQSSFDLLRHDHVKQELQLTDEQIEKLSKIVVDERTKMRPWFSGDRGKTKEERQEFWTKVRGEMRKMRDESMAQANDLLQPEQQKRLAQITLQVQMRRSGPASTSAIRALAKALSLTEDEKKKLVEGAEAIRKRLSDKTNAINDQAEAELLGMLTDEQRKELQGLTGKAFRLPTRKSSDRDGRHGRADKKDDPMPDADGA